MTIGMRVQHRFRVDWRYEFTAELPHPAGEISCRDRRPHLEKDERKIVPRHLDKLE
jgi:hypothetical protein